MINDDDTHLKSFIGIWSIFLTHFYLNIFLIKVFKTKNIDCAFLAGKQCVNYKIYRIFIDPRLDFPELF